MTCERGHPIVYGLMAVHFDSCEQRILCRLMAVHIYEQRILNGFAA